MANETPPVETEQQPSNVAPNLDAELDAALTRSFPNAEINPNETQEEKPVKTEAKSEDKAEPKQETKSESRKENKPVEVEKPILTPDEIDKVEPKEQSAWTALKNNNKRSHRLIEQKDAEIAKLKAVVAERGQLSQKEMEALKLENSELAKYRAMIDIQADPEFLSKFDQPIEKTVSSIKEMIKGMNVSDDVINKIDFTNTKVMAEIISHVGEHRDQFEARKLQRKVDDLLELTDKRDETLAEQKEHYKETLEAKKKQTFEKDAESEGRALKHLESISQTKDKIGNPAFPFLNRREIKDGATQPEIDQINGHNKMVELMNQKVQQAFKMNSPEERMEVAVAAAAAHYLSAMFKAETSKRKSVEAELQKISTVNGETERTKPPASKRNGDGNDRLDLDVSLNNFFNR